MSLLAWFGVIYFGRMIMYNDTLLYAFGKWRRRFVPRCWKS